MSDIDETHDSETRTPRWLIAATIAVLAVAAVAGVTLAGSSSSPLLSASSPSASSPGQPIEDVYLGDENGVVLLNESGAERIDSLAVVGPNKKALWTLPVNDGEQMVSFPMHQSTVNWCNDSEGAKWGHMNVYDAESGVGARPDGRPLESGHYLVYAIEGGLGVQNGEIVQTRSFNVSRMDNISSSASSGPSCLSNGTIGIYGGEN